MRSRGLVIYGLSGMRVFLALLEMDFKINAFLSGSYLRKSTLSDNDKTRMLTIKMLNFR